jgi:putative DNA primase/helicase
MLTRSSPSVAAADRAHEGPRMNGTRADAVEPVGELRSRLFARGYHPVPVSGPDVKTKSAGKRPLMPDWARKCDNADEAEIRSWSHRFPTSTNTGLLCGGIVGVDIDVPDETLAGAIERVALQFLGSTPLRRIGRAPKSLLVFRAATTFSKIQSREFPLGEKTVARVEILACGQQFVAFGVHPERRADYSWPEASPLEISVGELLSVSEETSREFIRRAEEMLFEAGAFPRRAYSSAGAKAGYPRYGREDILAALEHVPNCDLDYDSWIRIGFALRHGLGEAGADIWQAWSAQSSKNDSQATLRKWSELANGHSITVGTLFYLAHQNGWRGSTRSTDGPEIPKGFRKSERSDASLPFIQIRGGELPKIVDQAELALLAADFEIFQRGQMVVRPTVSTVRIARGGTTLAQRLVQVVEANMIELMTRAASWQRHDSRSRKWVDIDCPRTVAETYLARVGGWQLPVLSGVVNCPTLRADGSVIDTPGFDKSTGLLFAPEGTSYPPIPRCPNKDDAFRALVGISELIGKFPFVAAADRSVALSAILTPLLRSAISTAPLHAFTAPAAGTGKSLLVDIASVIATGHPCPVISQGRTEEELEKRLGAALLAGDTLLSLDNCERPLGGEFLCQALTQPLLKIRILGKSLNVEVPTNATFYATGNNLVLEADITRRAIRSALDAGLERPELREFDFDPVERAIADRGELVVSALTILLAYHVAGRPQLCKPLGSFGDWSWVRNALVWLDQADPCDTMENIRSSDPKFERLVAVIEQWRTVIGERRVSVRDVIDTATQSEHGAAFDRHEFTHASFREVLLAVANDGGAISSRRLGNWLSANQNRVVNGAKLVQDGIVQGITRWRLEIVVQSAGDFDE